MSTQLLDAQVAFHLAQWSEDQLPSTVVGLVDELLDGVGHHQIEDLVDREAVKVLVVRALGTVPGSAAVSGIVTLVTEVVYDGPDQAYPLSELVDRARVESVLDSLLALHPVLERFVEALAELTLVGTVASRFMGRIVGEVLQANKSLTDRVPGLGSLMSFGTSAASKVMGAADRQLEGLLGDTMGKGGSFAVRRLNRVVIDTLRDPTTRAAALQAWDRMSQGQMVGLAPFATQGQVSDVANALHELAVSSFATEPVVHLVTAIVDGFFDRFGGYSPTELLDELDLSREDLIEDLVRLAPTAVGALHEAGDLERSLRAQLEPFFASPEVGALLR